MTKASDNLFPKVLLDMQTSAPAAPSDADWKLYALADGVYARSSNAIAGPIGAASVSAGSNATRVSEGASGGAGPAYSYSDHRHDGIGQVTSSSSNTLQRGTLNIRAGANIGLAASDTDGDGEFDTLTIVAAASGAGGSSSLAFGANTYTGASKTTSSGSWADVDATYCSVTITTGARRCRVTATFMAVIDQANSLCFDVDIDGVRASGDTLGLLFTNNTQFVPFTISYITSVLTAASHTFKLQWMRTSAGTGTLYSGSGGSDIRMWVEELDLTA